MPAWPLTPDQLPAGEGPYRRQKRLIRRKARYPSSSAGSTRGAAANRPTHAGAGGPRRPPGSGRGRASRLRPHWHRRRRGIRRPGPCGIGRSPGCRSGMPRRKSRWRRGWARRCPWSRYGLVAVLRQGERRDGHPANEAQTTPSAQPRRIGGRLRSQFEFQRDPVEQLPCPLGRTGVAKPTVLFARGFRVRPGLDQAGFAATARRQLQA